MGHQNNKPFKSKHASKRSLKKKHGGKVEEDLKTLKSTKGKSTKKDRMEQARKRLVEKRAQVMNEKRRLGVSIRPISQPQSFAFPTNRRKKYEKAELMSCSVGQHLLEGCIRGHKLSLSITTKQITLFYGGLEEHSQLDAAKVADIIIFAVGADGISEEAEEIIRLIKLQGMPSTLAVVAGLSQIEQRKAQHERKREISEALKRLLTDDCKSFPLDVDPGEAKKMVRAIADTHIKTVSFRDKRAYLLASSAAVAQAPDGSTVLRIEGYLRGRPLLPTLPVHLTGHGTFNARLVEELEDPLPTKQRQSSSTSSKPKPIDEGTMMDEEPERQHIRLESNVTEREPPLIVAEGDPMQGEQTWPTEEELAEADKRAKFVRRRYKGDSDYQAAWIPDEDLEERLEEHDEEPTEAMLGVGEDVEAFEEEGYEGEDGEGSIAETGTVMDDEDRELMEGVDVEASQQTVEQVERLREASREDVKYPDEVDTPMDKPARERFMRYRGLKSFRTTPWDPKENLPAEYSKVHEFQRYRNTAKRVHELMDEEEVVENLVGRYVTVEIEGVPQDVLAAHMNPEVSFRPLILSGLLRHENRMTVVHFTVQRSGEYDEPIKSKTPMIISSGFRRFLCHPIFSTHSPHADKHKFERFWQPGRFSVASVYAPAHMVPESSLFFLKRQDTGSEMFVGSGGVLSCDPNRVILRRIVLSGFPFKIHKRKSVVRFMFFNKDDIRWFKPIDLWTKRGRRGHIFDSIGTHGYMKCVFDQTIQHHDTVCMSLYKRTYPKWEGQLPINEATYHL